MKITPEELQIVREYTKLDTELTLKLLIDYALIKADLHSARRLLKESGASGNVAARQWILDHPEDEQCK